MDEAIDPQKSFKCFRLVKVWIVKIPKDSRFYWLQTEIFCSKVRVRFLLLKIETLQRRILLFKQRWTPGTERNQN